MPKRNVITFVGDLSVFYDREILRATARRLESDPGLRQYSLCHLQPWDTDYIDIDASAGVLLGWLPDEPRQVRKLALRGVPVVNLCGATAIPWIKYGVRADDEAVGRAAAEYFLRRGFRCLALLDHGGHLGMARRRVGFTAAVAEANLIVRQFPDTLERGTRRFWPTGMLQWLRAQKQPVAVFCGNDIRAYTLTMALKQAGLRIPEDVSVLGVDDDDVYSLLQQPWLSSVRLQTNLIAENGVAMLVELMAGRKPVQSEVLVPPGEIITRASSDLLAAQDELVRAALREMLANLEHGISIKAILNKLKVSRPTLEKHFAAALGRSPAMEAHRMRLDRAKTLLATTNLPMAQVAFKSGYSSPQQLSVSFAHNVGMPPRDYRSRHNTTAYRPPALATSTARLQKGAEP